MDQLDRNRYAAHAEAALLREQIRFDEAAKESLQPEKLRAAAALNQRTRALRQAQEEANAAQSVYDSITAREDALDLRISLARGHFHPLRRLPDEVLGHMFLEWMAECPDCDHLDDEGPKCDHVCTRAAAVCRWWRRVALNLSELWRELTIRFDRVRRSSLDRWVAHLESHRLRSGRLPLKLDILGDWQGVPVAGSEPFWTSLKLCIAQACFVSVRAHSTGFHLHLRECIDQDAPLLVEFRTEVWLTPGTNHTLPFFRSAPLLRRLNIGVGFQLRWYPSLSTFPALTDANIDGTDAYGVVDLFHYMPKILSLEIYAVNLESSVSPEGFSVHSDVLQSLNWNIGDVCDASLVQRMHFPSLETAVLGFYDRSEVQDDAITAFLRHPMCTVHTLTLDHLEVAILEGLKYTRHVTILEFNYFTETSVAALQGLSHPSNNGGWLCPRLRRVTLSSFAECDPGPLQEAILAFAHARAPRAAVSTRARESLSSLHFDDNFRGNSFPANFRQLVDDILKPALLPFP